MFITPAAAATSFQLLMSVCQSLSRTWLG